MRQKIIRNLALSLTLVACGGDITPEKGEAPNTEACSLAVVGSDYSSTSVTLLDEEGEVCAANFLHSGSAAPGLVTAFSGDVVLSRAAHPDGLLTLVDRYPNAVITLVDVVTGDVHGQFSVGEGFAANPQDIFFWSSTRAYVTRHEVNPTPTPEEGDFDDGDDLVIVNPETGALLGRIDLSTHIPEGSDGEVFRARPGRMVRLGSLAWTALRGLSDDYQRGGEGVLVGVDGDSDAVVASLDLPGAKNCGGLSGVAGAVGFWGVCTGVFYEGAEQQVKNSGLFLVMEEETGANVVTYVAAEELQARPMSFEIASLDADRVVYIAVGDLGSSVGGAAVDDELFLYDRQKQISLSLDVTSGPYELGGVFWHGARDLLLVADANPVDPALLRLTIDKEGGVTHLSPVDTSPEVGLSPRLVGAFR